MSEPVFANGEEAAAEDNDLASAAPPASAKAEPGETQESISDRESEQDTDEPGVETSRRGEEPYVAPEDGHSLRNHSRDVRFGSRRLRRKRRGRLLQRRFRRSRRGDGAASWNSARRRCAKAFRPTRTARRLPSKSKPPATKPRRPPSRRAIADDEEEDDDEPEVTTLGGGGESDEPMRHARPRADDEGEPVELIGGDAMDETPRRAARPRRHYKIQEVIKRRQVLLVQVVKEERGNKGAALTTYLSLAGRYSVLMPNTARGGGISRKITNAQDRSRLKAIARGTRRARGHGRHPAHRRRLAHQAGGQARLRISAAHVGDGARDDARLAPRRRWSTRKVR